LTNVAGTLYFVANDGTNGRQLWKSDGTESGTLLVKEIIVHEEDWTPSATERRTSQTRTPEGNTRAPLNPERLVTLRLPSDAEALRAKVWAAGGRWDSSAKVWRMPYKAVLKMKLETSIVAPEGDTT
jgi:ELWxxDGT repeat protein